MPNLITRFEAAVEDVADLPDKPNKATMIRLHALFKQATDGDVSGRRPRLTDALARARWDAWAALNGTSEDEAMQAYIDLVEEIKAG